MDVSPGERTPWQCVPWSGEDSRRRAGPVPLRLGSNWRRLVRRACRGHGPCSRTPRRRSLYGWVAGVADEADNVHVPTNSTYLGARRGGTTRWSSFPRPTTHRLRDLHRTRVQRETTVVVPGRHQSGYRTVQASLGRPRRRTDGTLGRHPVRDVGVRLVSGRGPDSPTVGRTGVLTSTSVERKDGIRTRYSDLGKVFDFVHGVLASPPTWPPVYKTPTESARIQPCCRAVYYELLAFEGARTKPPLDGRHVANGRTQPQVVCHARSRVRRRGAVAPGGRHLSPSILSSARRLM